MGAHFFSRLRAVLRPFAGQRRSLWEIRCIRIGLRGIPEAVAVSSFFRERKAKKMSDFHPCPSKL